MSSTYFTNLIIDFSQAAARLFWTIGPIALSIWFFIYYVLRIRKRISEKETEIFKVKAEIDNMLETVHKKYRGYINQSQLEGITEKNRVPLRAKLETLQLERQFLLDKISILNLIKK